MKDKIIHYIIRKAKTGQYVAPWFIRKTIQRPFGDGKPTSENLSVWRNHFNKSLLKGGTNEHIGVNGWLQCTLEIYDQYTKNVVCTFNAPMFEVIP